MKTACLLALATLTISRDSRADRFPQAPPGQDASRLMRQRKDLLTDLTAAATALAVAPVKCGLSARVFAVLRKAELPASCPTAKDQVPRLLGLESALAKDCTGAKAAALLGKLAGDDDWYQKKMEQQAADKSGDELDKLECEIPLTLAYQARQRLEHVAKRP